ncbi:MAG: hypothetical protein HPY55_07100 [Firmicutes bacterium]|nr:hypothetical protein [Bacillota bacterium]
MAVIAIPSWKNLFLTGPSGAGKTTVLFRALKELNVVAGGYVVKRVYHRGRLCAMDIVDLAGAGRARLLDLQDPGRPQANPEAFLTVGVSAIRRAMSDRLVIVVDEIGRFELAAPLFLEAVTEALDFPLPVTGVLKQESNWFLDRIRSRADVRIVEVSRDAREAAKTKYTALLSKLLSNRPH